MKLVLKASAGTGKTYRLSLEYIIALLKGINFKEILVMTFTRKATAEIKKEVLVKIEKFLEIESYIPFNNNLVINEIENSLSISSEKKKEFISLIESIEKISDLKIDKKTLVNLRKIYDEILKNKEKIRIYTIDGFFNLIFKNLIVNYLQINNYSSIEEDENRAYYKKILEYIFSNKNFFKEFKDFFFENSEKIIDNYIDTISNLINNRWKYLMSLNKNGKFYEKEKFIVEDNLAELLLDIFNYIENTAKKELFEVLNNDFKKYLGKTENEINKHMLIDYKDFLTKNIYNGNKFKAKTDIEFKNEIVDKQEILRENLAKKIFNNALIPYENKIIEMSKKIYTLYDSYKIREKKFTFNDISTYTYSHIFDLKNNLLDENGLKQEFFDAIDMKINTVFIDEFQDTSILQWKVLFEIIKKAENIICVGDEKQSIYGWRDGEKRLFENLHSILGAKSENMDVSYRSDINIVTYTNNIFRDVSSKKNNWKFKESKPNSKKDGYVETIYLEKKKKKSKDSDNKILEEKETSVFDILIDKLKSLNLSSYNDIAIIGRKNSDLEEIAKLLEVERIPYTLNRKQNFKNINPIFEIIEFFKYILRDNELALFNFISSDISDFGTDEIEFLLKNKKQFLNYLNGLEDSLLIEKKNILVFLEKIKNFKCNKYLLKNSADIFINKLLNDFNFLEKYKKENQVKLIYEIYLLSKKYNNISEFFYHLENDKINFSETLSENEAIELMTIHKSKGLQYKTVFVIDKINSTRENEYDFLFKMNENYKEVDFSLFMKKGYKKILENCYPEIIQNYRQMEEEEKINNIYVAITRAKNNLIIISENMENFQVGNFDHSLHQKKDKVSITSEKYNFSDLKISEEQNKILSENTPLNKFNKNKFNIETEEKRMLGLLIHFFLENIKFGKEEEISFSKKLCYKNYISFFGEKKLNKILSEKNINYIINLAKEKEIFSSKWNYIYSEYEIFNSLEKKSYRIDRLMIKDRTDFEKGEIYIVDYKTGEKDIEQLINYKQLLEENFEELEFYNIKTDFIEFHIEY